MSALSRKQKAINFVVRSIADGKSRQTILRVLQDKFEYKKNSVSTIYQNIKSGAKGWA